ncbi:major facilitator superfamily transporter quinate [Niveomyces insectorum RCEF 264]|uniref:Major facilitator superfamily transporter quinate n=1 Tax=Niveomyces insectorum RCEF 264 TaxID=1081102 RepID=A0A167MEL9_9HYPO|nr:major facilitator superfamily transporter quinate [Niveomyces insectorum RCEF 264]
MATPEALAAQAAHQALIEQLDIHAIHKTFRNPHWRPNQRRNKNVKTILGDASRREASALASALATPQTNSGVNTPKNEDGLSTSGTSTPAGNGNGNGTAANGAGNGAGPAAAAATGLQPNLAQANRSLSKLVLEKSLKPGYAAANAAAAAAAATTTNAPAPVAAPAVTYTNVESAPSLAPQRRYCDITGLHAPYTDPKTRLRYHNSEVFTAIRGFQQGVAEQYLELRGAHTVLK